MSVKCGICGKTFKNMAGLGGHTKRMHKGAAVSASESVVEEGPNLFVRDLLLADIERMKRLILQIKG